MAISELDRAYLAGFFDGDGCVNIVKAKSNVGTPYYRVQVILAQKSADFLETLRAMTGGIGRVYTRTQKSKLGEHILATWRISSKQSEGFLELIEPYTIRKKKQVEIALRFRQTVSKPGGITGCRPNSDEVTALRDELMHELHDAKKL